MTSSTEGSSGSDSRSEAQGAISLSSEEQSGACETFRLEFIQYAGALAITNVTFVSSTAILKYKLEKRGGSAESTTKLLIYTIAGNSQSQALTVGGIFEPGDYNLGIQFTNEVEAKMYSALILTLKISEISNFMISQMFSSFARALNYPPSQVFGLKAKSAVEFVPFDKRIRSEIGKLGTDVISQIGTMNKMISGLKDEIKTMKDAVEETKKVIPLPTATTIEGNTVTTTSGFTIDSLTGRVTPLSNGISHPISTEPKEVVVPSIPIPETISKSTEILAISSSIANKVDLLQEVMKRLAEEKESKNITVSDVVEIAAQRNLLLAKLTQAENHIQKLEETLALE